MDERGDRVVELLSTGTVVVESGHVGSHSSYRRHVRSARKIRSLPNAGVNVSRDTWCIHIATTVAALRNAEHDVQRKCDGTPGMDTCKKQEAVAVRACVPMHAVV